jgi:TrmH family RNA methyltransferase
MPLKHVSSRDNPEYRALLDLAENARTRRALGATLLDGEHLIDEALRAGILPKRLIVQADANPRMGLERFPDVPTLALPEALFRKLSPVVTPTGIMAEIPVPRAEGAVGEFVLLLDAIQDPGNLGAILRSAAATGVTDVLLSVGCAEAWSPKALRGGQGGQFRLRIQEGVDLGAWLDEWPGKAFAAVPGAPRSLYELDLSGPVAFAFGNEGQGLGTSLRPRCQDFTIPMAGRVESLNVAVSVAVCLYERVRQGLK